MKPTYRIKDWSVNFENSRTKELKELRYVMVPNKHDGDGYTELLDHPNGAAHFGAWCAIVEVASKCAPRGDLVRQDGKPHDSYSLSRQTRIPATVFDEVLPRLIDIGWIESDPQPLEPHSDSTFRPERRNSKPEGAALTRARVQEGIGGEGIGGDRKGKEKEKKEEGTAAAKKRQPGKAVQTPAPEFFPVTDNMRAWAAENTPGLDVDDQAARFIDKARAKGWVYVEWVSGWHTWMRNAKKWADEDGREKTKPQRGLTSADIQRMKDEPFEIPKRP